MNDEKIVIRKVNENDGYDWMKLVNSVWRTSYKHIFPEEVFREKDNNIDTQESKSPTAMIQETIELLEEQLERLQKQLGKVEEKIRALSSIPNEYAKNMLLSLTEQATDLITKIMTISTRILELKKALA